MSFSDFQELNDVIINIFVTSKCNARCQECINQTITNNSNAKLEDLEINIERDLKILKNILQRHKELPAVICFYGGEPLLEPRRFVPVIENLQSTIDSNRLKYMIYTNGEFLKNFFEDFPEIAKKIWIYAVSIDGDEEQHNRFRIGTDLKRIKENLKFMKEHYDGNILMWSTLREEQSLLKCFEEFLRLFRDGLVNHFFWHWLETSSDFEDFQAYFNSYIHDLRLIVDYYIRQLRNGNLLPIAHLNELILYLITGKERSHTSCGAELEINYDLVGGEILACVDLPFEIGKELKQNPEKLLVMKDALGCHKCAIHFYCGGRCPIQIIYGTKLRTRQYCELLRAHVKTVEERLDEIKEILLEQKIDLQEIYDRSAFIVRYTDVTP
ncbi:MAG: 4Fe-4S cluster-binding domain-containing protein [candidate division WOR-3 bacterium]|nr:4Fe-4S cluster-binding domain-containing protein [candidate division WOR-3 bacterium]